MSKSTVLITRPDFPEKGITKIKENYDVEIFEGDRPITKDELVERVKGKNGVLCTAPDPIDADVIAAAGKDLKVISTMSVGYEHIDLKECAKRNIKVGFTPNVSVPAVTEWTVLLMIAASRNFMQKATAVKEGKWKSTFTLSWDFGYGLYDAVVGIVGMGKMGHAIIDRLLPFEVKQVLYYDHKHSIETAERKGARYAEFDELLKSSDFVVCMVRLCESTKHLFNKESFAKMKKESVFINTSRGGVVNHTDLYEALKSNTIRCAAIDVTDPEPLPADSELLTLPNLIITPHVSSAEGITSLKMCDLATANILSGLSGEDLKAPIPLKKVL